MAYIPDQQINTGSFVPTTNIWDVSRIYEVDIQSPEFKELLVRLYQNVNLMALVLNAKDSAYYLPEEFATGRLFYNPNSNSPLNLIPGFRKWFLTGALGAGVTAVNHNLSVTTTWKFISISGCASDTAGSNYYPLPFPGATGNNIEVRVTSTQIVITNNSGATFDYSEIILEYIKM